MKILSIKIPNVSQSLEEKLEALILGGAFWPDQPLASERRLAEEFGVSRTSLRNALASLLEKGLLTQDGKRYCVTNVMADLLKPGFLRIEQNNSVHLLDFWILFFEATVDLAERKARNSDKVATERAARALKQSLASEDARRAIDAFERLCRAVLDGCYNFFLSQTHHALLCVIRPYLLQSFRLLFEEADGLLPDLGMTNRAMGKFSFDGAAFRNAMQPGFENTVGQTRRGYNARAKADPTQIIAVVLRHSLSFEAVYELRLINETHAAVQAAANADKEQRKSLKTHLDQMTEVADNSPTDYSALDTELHHMITECSQNPVFTVIDAALAPIFSRTTNHWLKKHMEIRNDHSAIHLQHTQIVEAIIDRNEDAAKEAMREHLAYVLRNLRYMRQQDHLQEISTARRLLG